MYTERESLSVYSVGVFTHTLTPTPNSILLPLIPYGYYFFAEVQLAPFGMAIGGESLMQVDDSFLGPFALDFPVVFYGVPETTVIVSV